MSEYKTIIVVILYASPYILRLSHSSYHCTLAPLDALIGYLVMNTTSSTIVKDNKLSHLSQQMVKTCDEQTETQLDEITPPPQQQMNEEAYLPDWLV